MKQHSENENSGYERIASASETAASLPVYPLIPLSDTEMQDAELRIKLEFSNIGGEKPRSVHGGISLSRTLKNDTGTRVLMGFTPTSFSEGDSDLPTDFDPASNFDVTIALYVMSYGNDYLNLSFNIHSTGVYLGNSDLVLSQ